MKMDGLLSGTEDSHPIHNYAYYQPNPGKKDWIYKMKRVKGTQVASAKCSKCPRQGNARCPEKLCAQCCMKNKEAWPNPKQFLQIQISVLPIMTAPARQKPKPFSRLPPQFFEEPTQDVS